MHEFTRRIQMFKLRDALAHNTANNAVETFQHDIGFEEELALVVDLFYWFVDFKLFVKGSLHSFTSRSV